MDIIKNILEGGNAKCRGRLKTRCFSSQIRMNLTNEFFQLSTKPGFIISAQDLIIIMDWLTCFHFPNEFFNCNYFVLSLPLHIIPINNFTPRQEGCSLGLHTLAGPTPSLLSLAPVVKARFCRSGGTMPSWSPCSTSKPCSWRYPRLQNALSKQPHIGFLVCHRLIFTLLSLTNSTGGLSLSLRTS